MGRKVSESKDAKSSSEQSNKRVSRQNPKYAADMVHAGVDDAMDEIEEAWDHVRNIDKGEKMVCRYDNCKTLAVAIWASNIKPDDLWALCKECQDMDFPQDEQDDTNTTTKVSPAATEKGNNEVEEGDLIESDNSGKNRTKNQKESESHHRAKSITTNDESLTPEHEGDKSFCTTSSGREHQSFELIDVKMKDAPSKIDDSDLPGGAVVPRADVGTPPLQEGDEGEEAPEAWELVQVLSLDRLEQDGTIKCSSESCTLAACSVWKSNLAPTVKWYSCIDCQEADFEGWPPHEELILKHTTEEHKRIMMQKCTKQSKPTFPDLWNTISPTKEDAGSDIANTITPSSNHILHSSFDQQDGGTSSKVATITPMPGKSQPSKSAMDMHRKWQEAAEAVGGAGARIVVSKPAAKKLIFDKLHDAFCPMNITQIHSALKAVVPSPVLKSCLTEMIDSQDDDENAFTNSDDESPKKLKKKVVASDDRDLFAGSLSFKVGRNTNTSLYYVSHSKLKNNGNGLDPHARNDLFSDKIKTDKDESDLKHTLAEMEAHTKQLLSEPTNEKASVTHEIQEKIMDVLRENLEAARALKVNEKTKKQIKRRIEGMTAQWRKRRRICMDFLISMEESTDGTVSAKKCLSGDGQIDIDSDQIAIRDAKAYATKKKMRKSLGSRQQVRLGKGASDGSKDKSVDGSDVFADENFIAVELDAQGNVSRVYLVNEEA